MRNCINKTGSAKVLYTLLFGILKKAIWLCTWDWPYMRKTTSSTEHIALREDSVETERERETFSAS